MSEATFTVRELNELIRATLSLTFPDEVWVEGEIASLARRPSGHVYFQLVSGDAHDRAPDASVGVVLFASAKRRVNEVLRTSGAVRMTDGVHLRLRARIDFYPAQGRLQLVMSDVDPEYTLGRLAAARGRVLARLEAEGLLGANAARGFPLVPHHVGLVTSPGSAAHADFVHELERSGLGWRVSLAPTRMQGPGADREVADAIGALVAAGVEVIAVVRGGGARTDLATFDDEGLARAIAATPVPVLTGIGHEIDHTVADAVASRAYKTPTACAAGLVEQVRDAQSRVDEAWAGIARRAVRRTEQAVAALETSAARIAAAADRRIAAATTGLDREGARLGRAAGRALTDADRHLAVLAARTDALDPARALARGWSVTRTADGRVVRDPAALHPGDTLVTTLAAGTVHSRVTETPTDDPA